MKIMELNLGLLNPNQKKFAHRYQRLQLIAIQATNTLPLVKPETEGLLLIIGCVLINDKLIPQWLFH